LDFLIGDPIIACSTHQGGNAGIAVIRLSGFSDFSQFNSFFKKDINKFSPRTLHLVQLFDENQKIDQIMLSIFPAPHSFTGENVIELNVHGNLLNIEKIIGLFITKAKFRLARPGEFSYRALVNKKLSLSQVEGLDLFLNANTDIALNSGISSIDGEIHSKYLELKGLYKKLRASIELSIDFLDDIGEEQASKLQAESMHAFNKLILELNGRTQGDFSQLLNPSIALVGHVNAGKSTLFNYLLKNNRSIVSSIKGTTRDYISEFISFKGTNFRIVDTAGIRETKDPIEKEGINRSLDLVNDSFYKVLVLNPLEEVSDWSYLDGITFDLVIFTHADLIDNSFSYENSSISYRKYACFGIGPIGPVFSKVVAGPIGPDGLGCGPIGPGDAYIPENKEVLEDAFLNFSNLTNSDPILIPRQRSLISNIYQTWSSIYENILKESDIGIVSSEINRVEPLLDELIGVLPADEILGEIFSNFCIGK
jgi:tRNA modification GTPase